jgi:hypothetical protein
MSLWGALSDERPGLSFVSYSLVACLCVHLLFTFLLFTHLPSFVVRAIRNTNTLYGQNAGFNPCT